jgi:peroxiredoxin
MKINPIFILIFSTFLFWQCSNSETDENLDTANKTVSNATINGLITDGAGKKIILYEFKSDKPKAIDSTTMDNTGAFTFVTPMDGFGFIGVGESFNQAALLLIKGGDAVNLKGSLNAWNLNFEIEGSPETITLTEYYKKRYDFGIKMQNLQMQADSIAPDDEMAQTQIKATSEALLAEFESYKYEYIDKNINSPAVYIAFADIYDPVKDYDILVKMEATLMKHMPGSTFTNQVSEKLAQGKSMQEQANSYEEQKKMMEAQLLAAGIGVGLVAPEIALPNPTGKTIKLSSLKGKVVLLDFWASWCKPCRMENPAVVKLYNEYKDKGFTVYSVSLDDQKENWTAAIQTDGLVWPNHVSDLKGWQSAAGATYMVQSIPQTFLIDADGKIIAVGLRSDELAIKLKEIFG